MRPRWLLLRSLALLAWLLWPQLGCSDVAPASPTRAGSSATSSSDAEAKPRRRSTYAERVKQGRDLARLAPRRKALFRALSLQEPAEQLAETRREPCAFEVELEPPVAESRRMATPIPMHPHSRGHRLHGFSTPPKVASSISTASREGCFSSGYEPHGRCVVEP